jgi:hypothetical protein
MDHALDLGQAATYVGLTTQAVRQRVKRGSLPAHKGEDGRWYVQVHDLDELKLRLNADQVATQTADSSQSIPPADGWSELVSQLRDENHFLRGELTRVGEERAEAERRRDILLSQFSEQLKSLSATTSPPATSETNHHHQPSEPSETPKRSWWEKLFGLPT